MRILERSNNKQLAINMGASLVTFVVNFCITFFLTPYIVRSLGAEAYGFIKISSDIIGYTGLVTVALNSMAGRFITIAYTSGDTNKANRYFSSVFFSNIIIASIIISFSLVCILFIEYIIKIPDHLIFDVKILISLLAVNNTIGVVFGTWGVSTFIKNRLDLTNIRTIVGNILNAMLLFVLFTFFVPRIWYVGIAGMVMTIYVTLTNIKFAKLLTPDLVIKKIYFEYGKVIELLSSGVWNLLNKINVILEYGLDLIIANWFLGATYMGLFALTKSLPFFILGLFQMIAAVFAPIFTQLYAKKQQEELLNNVNKSIRILGFISSIPIACLWLLGEDFYKLWLPSENASILQNITILSTIVFIVAMPLESLWNIFTITNKLKYSTLAMLLSSIIVIAVIMISMYFTHSELTRLYILASTRSFVGVIRTIFFLPIYGAYCLCQPLSIFYKTTLKTILCTCLSMVLLYVILRHFSVDGWVSLIFMGIVISATCIIINYFGVLTKNDRDFIIKKTLKIIN